MGTCIRSAEQIHSPTRQLQVSASIPNAYGYDVSLINKSYFYFLLRKEIYARLKDRTSIFSQFIDMRDFKEYSAFHFYLSVNVGPIDKLDSSLKVLYDFRNIVLVDDTKKERNYELPENYRQFLAKLKQLKVTPTKIMIVAMPIRDFMKEYQMFIQGKNEGVERSAMSKLNLPILVLDSDELRPKEDEHRLRIFIHNLKMYERNMLLQPNFYQAKLYTKIQSNEFCVNSVESANDQAKIGTLKKQIKQAYDNHTGLLILHSLSEQQDIILKHIMKIIADMFGVNYSNALQYFTEKFPAVSSQVTDEEKKQVVFSVRNTDKPEDKPPPTKAEQFQGRFKKYNSECGKQITTEKAYTLCNMLLDNICKNPEPQSYRTIKTTNSQLGEVLFKYKTGKKLLQSIGFFQQEGNIYRNDLEVKYLRNYRTDLELGFRKFEDSLKD